MPPNIFLLVCLAGKVIIERKDSSNAEKPLKLANTQDIRRLMQANIRKIKDFIEITATMRISFKCLPNQMVPAAQNNEAIRASQFVCPSVKLENTINPNIEIIDR